MTNADKIRSMTDEQLADWLLKLFGDNELYCEVCVFCYDCECVSPSGYACRDAAIKWLQEETKDND